MIKRFINFGSIEQFRTIVKNVQWQTQRVGIDENGYPIIDRSVKFPVVTAVFSEKNHGTNAAFVYTKEEQWYQSGKNIITVEKDNAGCAFMMESRKDIFDDICINLANEHNIDLSVKGIALYAELSGGNIQKNACFSGIDKLFTIFQHAKVFNLEPVLDEDGDEEANFWIETKVNGKFIDAPEKRIWNMMNLNSGKLEVDFNRPDIAQNIMVKMIEEHENNSPAGNKLGLKDTILEGFVCTFQDDRGNLHRWKVKGEAHSKSKVKTIKPVDSVKEQAKIDFANYATPAWRLEQAWQTVFGIENEKQEPDIKFTADFLKAVISDVMKEELDVLVERGLEPKEVNRMISKVARQWFMDELHSSIGL